MKKLVFVLLFASSAAFAFGGGGGGILKNHLEQPHFGGGGGGILNDALEFGGGGGGILNNAIYYLGEDDQFVFIAIWQNGKKTVRKIHIDSVDERLSSVLETSFKSKTWVSLK